MFQTIRYAGKRSALRRRGIIMEELFLSLIPVITSTTGITIISLITRGLLKHTSEKNDDKINEVKTQNRLLAEQNKMLSEKLDEVLSLVNDNLAKNTEAVNKIVEDVAVNKENELAFKKLVDEGTTIRNELRGLIEAKKE